ncbi:MAG: hypothetical protein ACHQXA_02970 [Gemmatimonadales bacterium]
MTYDEMVFVGVMAAMFGVVLPITLAWFIPMAKARARRLEREGMAVDPDLIAEVDQLRARLGEVEERLDFAERMLAQRAAPPELPAERRS